MRHPFTKTQMRDMRARSGDICEAGQSGTEKFYGMVPGATCDAVAREFDHVVADALKRAKPQSIDEGLHVCLVHHKIKTHGNDRPKIGKAKRIDEEAAGIPKRRNSREIPSRPFRQGKGNVKQLRDL